MHLPFLERLRIKGLCKEEKYTNPRLLWKWVGGSRSPGIFFFKSSQNSPKPVPICWSSIPRVFCLYYTLLKVVGYYYLSVLSVSVMGFQKNWMGGRWVG